MRRSDDVDFVSLFFISFNHIIYDHKRIIANVSWLAFFQLDFGSFINWSYLDNRIRLSSLISFIEFGWFHFGWRLKYAPNKLLVFSRKEIKFEKKNGHTNMIISIQLDWITKHNINNAKFYQWSTIYAYSYRSFSFSRQNLINFKTIGGEYLNKLRSHSIRYNALSEQSPLNSDILSKLKCKFLFNWNNSIYGKLCKNVR